MKIVVGALPHIGMWVLANAFRFANIADYLLTENSSNNNSAF